MPSPSPHCAIGRSERVTDTLDLRQARLMQLTLDRPATLTKGDPLPPFWHYLYFNPQIRASDLGRDGHERLGRFIPDFGLPRRMWAGGRVTIDAPLRLGEEVEKRSTIRSIEEKTGRSGRLCFVTVDHDFSVGGEHRIRETQNIVYRQPPAPGSAPPTGQRAPDDARFSRVVTPDPVTLFRYSALIFYGHRIHYDADYTREVEGYPSLVVHGPLTATLLVDLGLAHLGDRRLTAFDIRAMQPLFAPTPYTLEGRATQTGVSLWARTPDGATAMTVTLHAVD
ncbi:MaoC family dehydratase N-terminal domain-containing protein [Lutimaribacter sp. EGI FJ00015]|uniref:MaoC family dehydratase N-terminal domain-containing protein n=1 Tax=Lutimaribacter degradans TaxID=2945989 RepID=A0ACC5ZY22_9RHOB|nr:MaoC family dehydratase N-terminal domain-containing protein [Lutimaribacter sp. EGI FJ00013]MCM2562966.1 MaoC family dehydratase N-terminal domain-containing protein [Lutimaribacter sp. EGI FJ00013]MCO0614134.1 MaoC family dehydratase N-terminal domain-containing protein [Lutimaribacter sp. EGI FJ00015]MCO0636111.1 MaoC family dehydratase N-terminal domain-containing protein [Lutimaribacter sp. EGI FJ00014]